jgi:hypothetical protein
MKPIRKPSAALLALMMITTSLMIPAQSARSQGKDENRQRQQPVLEVRKTRLEVREGSGEFEQWVKTLTITYAHKLLFAWDTDEPGVATAEWMVTDKVVYLPQSSPIRHAPHVIANGPLTQVPQKGHRAFFEIDFAQFAPKSPPKNPKSYLVHIVTKNAQQQPVGSTPSATVTIIYRAQPASSVDLSGIPAEEPKPMPIKVSLHRFEVNRTNEGEGDDDPYLLIAVIYADGTTINPRDLAHSSVRIDSPSKTHNNLLMDAYDNEPRSGKSYSIPYSLGAFEKAILPLHGAGSLQTAQTLSTVAVLVIVMEEDNTSDSAANAGRKALVNNLQQELNAAIRSGAPPDPEAIQNRVRDRVIQAVKKETLSDWWAPWGLFDAPDPDDFIGANFAIFNYKQILDAGIKGLPISLTCKSSEGSYTITGSIGRL